MQDNISIRFMKQSDLDSVSVIEESLYDYPWSRSIFHDCLCFGYYCLALLVSDQLVGYAILSVAAGECHILNFAIEKSKQRQGLGLHFLCDILARAKQAEVDSIILEVRPSNTAAVNLYKKQGFKQIGIRKQYYRADQGREDAVVMKLEI